MKDTRGTSSDGADAGNMTNSWEMGKVKAGGRHRWGSGLRLLLSRWVPHEQCIILGLGGPPVDWQVIIQSQTSTRVPPLSATVIRGKLGQKKFDVFFFLSIEITSHLVLHLSLIFHFAVKIIKNYSPIPVPTLHMLTRVNVTNIFSITHRIWSC